MIPTLITAINTLELIGSHIVTHLESGTTIDRTNRKNRKRTNSAIPVICRELIKQGHDPQEAAHVIRKALDQPGMISAFMQDRTLAAWAVIDVAESDLRLPHTVRHRPHSVAVDAKNAHERLKGPHPT
ncbi:hypothetical protein WNZ14_07010 [Hoeflea sp. AS60]|uniref:hypothetical protein n=1 Tax=Hoeflea sp. AS60 TaxID=3135780 RepID=UPI00318297D9